MHKKTFNIFGNIMHCDNENILNLQRGVYEPAETKFSKSYLKEGNIVLDVGAHVGYYTLIFSDIVGPTGQVHAFEPNPDSFAINTLNNKENNKTNTILNNIAASNKEGKLEMYLSPINTGDHRTFSSPAEPRRPHIDVACTTLDKYAEENGILDKVDFIKMDLQAYEYFAIQGMEKILEANEDICFITEFWPWGLRQAGLESKTFLDKCLDLGFKYKVLYHNKPDPVENVPVETLLARPQTYRNWYVNLIWKRDY